jgi:hypothetical protein
VVQGCDAGRSAACRAAQEGVHVARVLGRLLLRAKERRCRPKLKEKPFSFYLNLISASKIVFNQKFAQKVNTIVKQKKNYAAA